VISDRQRDVLSLFRDGEHLATAGSAQELREKVSYYLDHAGERERIARGGREEVLRRHTYAQRLGSLLGTASAGRVSAGWETAAAAKGTGR
jgi:spore maturation protein CgeB